MNKLTADNTLSTNTLKIIAIAAMVCDHLPYILLSAKSDYYSLPWIVMHCIGRLTAPIFFYLLALGYRRTSNANKYTVRLLVFALISYLPYIWYFEFAPPDKMNFLELNVIFTMLFGLLLLRVVHEVQNGILKAVLLVLCLFGGYWCDYGLFGIAMILICDVTRDRRLYTILGLGAVIMVAVYENFAGNVFGLASPLECPDMIASSIGLQRFLILMLCQLLPLILISRHRAWAADVAEPKPGFLAKWGFYIFYPAHITVFLLIRLLI